MPTPDLPIAPRPSAPLSARAHACCLHPLPCTLPTLQLNRAADCASLVLPAPPSPGPSPQPHRGLNRSAQAAEQPWFELAQERAAAARRVSSLNSEPPPASPRSATARSPAPPQSEADISPAPATQTLRGATAMMDDSQSITEGLAATWRQLNTGGVTGGRMDSVRPQRYGGPLADLQGLKLHCRNVVDHVLSAADVQAKGSAAASAARLLQETAALIDDAARKLAPLDSDPTAPTVRLLTATAQSAQSALEAMLAAPIRLQQPPSSSSVSTIDSTAAPAPLLAMSHSPQAAAAAAAAAPTPTGGPFRCAPSFSPAPASVPTALAASLPTAAANPRPASPHSLSYSPPARAASPVPPARALSVLDDAGWAVVVPKPEKAKSTTIEEALDEDWSVDLPLMAASRGAASLSSAGGILPKTANRPSAAAPAAADAPRTTVEDDDDWKVVLPTGGGGDGGSRGGGGGGGGNGSAVVAVTASPVGILPMKGAGTTDPRGHATGAVSRPPCAADLLDPVYRMWLVWLSDGFAIFPCPITKWHGWVAALATRWLLVSSWKQPSSK